MPIALLIALLMSGSVSYAAEGTAPGDILYPVKIHVNENVRGILAVSDTAKAKLEVELLDRRLNEAEKLESEHRLDATTSAELKTDFTEHRTRAGEHLKSMRDRNDEDAVTISADLDTRIEGHHDVLTTLGFEQGDNEGNREQSGEHQSEGSRHGEGSAMLIDATTSFSASTSLKIRGEHSDKQEGRDTKQEGGERQQESAVVSNSGDVRSGGQSRGGERDDEGDDEEHGGGIIPSVVTPILTPTPVPSPSPTLSTGGSTASTFTLLQIATHNNQSSCYTAISGKVYNLTSFIGGHPGGASAILSLCGHDVTVGFMAQHGGASRPQNVLTSLYIGTLVQ